MTAEERKIKRLESEVKRLKEHIKDLEDERRGLEYQVQAERGWRMDFQRLLKAASFDDNLTEYERRYY